jgi:hypothetical protein
MGIKGASLIEVMLAVAIVFGMVTTVAMFIPMGSRALTQSRQKWLASNYATSRMQQLTTLTYDSLTPTPATNANFPKSGLGTGPTLAGGCNCSQEDLSLYPVDSSATVDSVTYSWKFCINLMENVTVVTTPPTWTSHCPDGTSATDYGMKNVRVHVDWTSGSQAHSTDMESMVIR